MKKAKYITIYEQIKNDILTNKILSNEKLPSKRELSKELNVSLNTIINAYNLLLEEGLIISKEKKGYYVIEHDIKNNTTQILEEEKKDDILYDFTTKNIDYNSFAFYTWAKISKNILYNNYSAFEKSNYKGDYNLRKTISNHLLKTKGIKSDPFNIIIGSGVEYLFTLIISILNHKDFYIENPGYPKIKKILENNNLNVNYLQIDEFGAKENNINKLSTLYLTPQNQFPTGIKMTLERKLEIIKKIKEYNGYIIEDDFDSDFKLLKNNDTSFYNLYDKTIFLSTFSRSISPSFRIAYMILPSCLLETFNNNYKTYSSTVSTIDQLTLNEFISGGYFIRHINKTKNLYIAKKDIIVNKLKEYNFIKIDQTNSYSSLNIEVNINKGKFINLCAKNKIAINLLQDYYFTNTTSNKIIIGYSSIDIKVLNTSLDLLIKIIKESL